MKEYYQRDCLKKSNKFYPNVNAIITRIDTNTIHLGLGRIYRKNRHSFGLFLTVIFNNNNQIEKILKATWIE